MIWEVVGLDVQDDIGDAGRCGRRSTTGWVKKWLNDLLQMETRMFAAMQLGKVDFVGFYTGSFECKNKTGRQQTTKTYEEVLMQET